MISIQSGDIDVQQWQKLLECSEVASWWQSPKCLDLYCLATEELIPFVYGVKRDEQLTGVCLGYLTRGRFYSRRAIIIGGPLLHNDCEQEEVRKLMSAVAEHCRREGAVYVETRNFADYSKWKEGFAKAGFEYQAHYDITIDLADPDAPWRQNIHRSSRANIRKAMAENETWRIADSEADVRAWYGLLSHLYRTKIHRPLFSLAFFMDAWQKGYVTLLVTEEGGSITGGTLLTSNESTSYEWYKCGRVMATYAGLEWSEQQGITRFDMMGAGAPGVPYGVRDFKLQMGGELHEYGRYLSVQKPFFYKLGKTVVELRG